MLLHAAVQTAIVAAERDRHLKGRLRKTSNDEKTVVITNATNEKLSHLKQHAKRVAHDQR